MFVSAKGKEMGKGGWDYMSSGVIAGISGQGERRMHTTLLAEGNAEATVLLGHLWDEVTKGYVADTLCGYLWSAFRHKESAPIFKSAEH